MKKARERFFHSGLFGCQANYAEVRSSSDALGKSLGFRSSLCGNEHILRFASLGIVGEGIVHCAHLCIPYAGILLLAAQSDRQRRMICRSYHVPFFVSRICAIEAAFERVAAGIEGI